LLVVALVVVAVPALVQLGWHLRLFAGRAGFPLDLEWMEGGTLVHAQRIAAGQGIYVKPSLDFIPYLYTPLYPALLALLSLVVPLGYLLGRAVSLLALFAALVLLGALVVGEARGLARSRRLLAALVGMAGAAAVVAAFAFTGGFFDLVRSDSLLLALEALALWLVLRGRTWKSAAVAGLAIAAAFFSKQTASIIGVGLGVGLLAVNWRRGLVYGGAAAAALAAGIGLLVKTSDGWFWTYIFKLHQSHGYRWGVVSAVVLPETLKHLWPVFAVLIVATAALAWTRKLRRTDIILWLAALAGEVGAAIGFSTQWAFSNAYIPAVFFPVLAASVLSGRLLLHALDRRRWLSAVPACAVLLGLAWQNQHIPRPKLATWLPQASDRLAAGRLLDRLASVPGDLFIPFHSYYGALVGKRTFVHRMGVRDVGAGLGRPEGLDQALQAQFFSAIVLDWKTLPGEFPFVDSRYHLWRPLREGVDSVRMFAGAETSPSALLVPTSAPPPLPPEGSRLADFETGTWQIFVAEGEAFGKGPAAAPPGMYGRFAADSTRPGPAAQGALRSAPFTVDRAHLRFVLSGPADRGLRVALLDGGKVVRAASPSGATATVDWDTSELFGRRVVLLVEDKSASGGLAFDEVVTW
jgi:Protein of unknown function (DUF2029).